MTRRTIIVGLAALALSLTVAAATPRSATAVSFVDKQVQASGLIIQNYVNQYGQSHRFTYPAAKMVRKGGGLKTPVWPANPWTGKIMAPGSKRGNYTYSLRNGGTSYRLVVHLSRGNSTLTGGMPKWLKTERDTGSNQNRLLLQRSIEAWAAAHAGVYPEAGTVTKTAFGAGYVWPVNPWTGAEMVAGDGLGDFLYKQMDGGRGYSLQVKLTSGWSAASRPSGIAGLLAANR